MNRAARLARMAMRVGGLTVLAWLGSGGIAAAADASSPWSLRRPAAEKTVFRGMVSYDSAGVGAGTMLYPAPNAVGFLAAILTHGLLNEGAKKAQKDKLQADADAVLQPYVETLAALTHERLLSDSLAQLPEGGRPRLVDAQEVIDGAGLIEIAPVFMMTGDQRALVLDNALRVVPPGGGEATTQIVRVISDPLPGADAEPSAVWLAEGGARLRQQSAALLAESITIALRSAATPAAELPQRTFRFALGAVERMERAQLVSERCDRLLLRTLRWHLMSVPAREPNCPKAAS